MYLKLGIIASDFTKFDSSIWLSTSVLFRYIHEGISCTKSKVCIYLVFLITGFNIDTKHRILSEAISNHKPYMLQFTDK